MNQEPALVPVKKERKLNNNQQVIIRLVSTELSERSKYFWPREAKFASQLIREYGIEYMLWLPLPNGYKMSSLIWFLTDEGRHYLTDNLLEFRKQSAEQQEQKTEIPISEHKIGKDLVIESRPKTLKDFLIYAKT